MVRQLFNFIAWLLFSATVSGCTYYRYAKNQESSNYYQSNIASRWKELDRTNYLVVHYGGSMKELYNVQYSEGSKEVSGNLRPLSGQALELYNKVIVDNDRVSRRGLRNDRSAVKQIHFFVKNAVTPDSSNMRFLVSDIEKVDASDHATALNILLPLGLTAAAFGIFLAIACNCPHVYVDNGTTQELTNSMYTGAKAPQLERFDYKQMPDYFTSSPNYSVNIVNELNEQQYTNMLELLVALHPKEVQVVADKQGRLFTIQQLQQPLLATDINGRTIMSEVGQPDLKPYKFNTATNARFSEVYMQFAVPEQQPEIAKLLVRLRNTPWSGFVYNQFSSLFGKNYSRWVEKNKNVSKEEREKWMREQGIQMQVEMKTDKGWQVIDEIDLIGETNFNSIVIPLNMPAGSKLLDLRLRTGFMFWELDYAAIDYSPEVKIETQVLKPVTAVGDKGQNYLQQLSFDDNSYMEHLGEKAATSVAFTNLLLNPALQRTIILRSKGYYTSKEEFTGKTYRKELKKFKNPGELSRFSQSLYNDLYERTAKN